MAQLWIVVTYKLVQWFVLWSVAADNGHNHLWTIKEGNDKLSILQLTVFSLALHLQSSTIGLKNSRDVLQPIIANLVFLDHLRAKSNPIYRQLQTSSHLVESHANVSNFDHNN